ncbi:E3 ubiquitin-protein ligase FANCL [Frankliniella fusca]|uniref:E3 ubiquitin-protein ligase FANCL n=1 Tax=Frankliniella fusca TaxID=407009 RepID=A0AAE1LN56_9NEOP|nr:E3 ubiquitin-protein ligase FANCL [Frankliniella fusca]
MATPSASEIQLDILRKFPLLVPKKLDFTCYEGFLEIKGFSFRISFDVPNYPSSKGISFDCDWKLSELLQKHKNTIVRVSPMLLSSYLFRFIRRVNDTFRNFFFVSKMGSSEIIFNEYLDKLNSLMVDCLDSGDNSHLYIERENFSKTGHLDNLNHYTSILTELIELGTDNLISISSDFRSVSLSSAGCNGEEHVLNIKFNHDETHDMTLRHSFEVVDTDMPEAIIKIIQKENTISRAFRVFCDQIRILSRIWSSLALFDQQCWLIDPINPRKADMYRRIFISPPSVMAQLSWDPLKPSQPPIIKFQGADAEIDKLRCLQEKHLEDWDEECSILDNICSVLQLKSLPQPPPPETNSVSQTVEMGECSICYTIEDEGGILPEESCGKCLSNFHAACLYEWLEGLPGSRLVHGHISGPCPNCETAMKCPCPHT